MSRGSRPSNWQRNLARSGDLSHRDTRVVSCDQAERCPWNSLTEVRMDGESPVLVFVYRLPAVELQRHGIEIDALPIACCKTYRIGIRASTEQK